jgi:transcriptional regulator GlxA family with amidase domain
MTRFLLLAGALLLPPSSWAQTDTLATRAYDTHEDAMVTFGEVVGPPSVPLRTIGILVYDGVNELDVMGPRYVLGQLVGVQTMLVGPSREPVRTVMGVQILPDTTMDAVDALDVLVVPGGFRGTIQAAYDASLHEWIRAIDQTTTYTAAVCTGTWIVGAAGLLDGRRATTNWYRAEEMMDNYGATFTGERWSRDGKYWTSAGVTAGMDMSLALVGEVWSEAYAQALMLDMEYDPAPPFEGGSPERTPADVYRVMFNMYDAAVQPLIDSLEAQREQ